MCKITILIIYLDNAILDGQSFERSKLKKASFLGASMRNVRINASQLHTMKGMPI
jgi:uncharacterized protein YjbI with pentapeptide repeats